jgi:hypothetical protein
MSSVRLLHAGAWKHDGNRPEQNFRVKPERSIVNVFEIEPHPVLDLIG